MTPKPLVIIFASILSLSACTKNPSEDRGVRGLSSNDAQHLNAQRSSFDSAEDPPLRANTHYAAGQLAEAQNAIPHAIEQYRAAIKIDPAHRQSLYRLAVLYTQTRAFEPAVAAWNQYIQHTASDATGYANLGYCYELAGRNADAESAYQQGINRDPKNNPCRINYGLMLARLNRSNEAIIHLQAVLPPAQVHYNLASVYELQGRRDQARAEYRKALEIDPDLADARTRLAALE